MKRFGGYNLEAIRSEVRSPSKFHITSAANTDVIILHNVPLYGRTFDVRWDIDPVESQEPIDELIARYEFFDEPNNMTICVPPLSVYAACIQEAYRSTDPLARYFGDVIHDASSIGVTTSTYMQRVNGKLVYSEKIGMLYEQNQSPYSHAVLGDEAAWQWITGFRPSFLHTIDNINQRVIQIITTIEGGVCIVARNQHRAVNVIGLVEVYRD